MAHGYFMLALFAEQIFGFFVQLLYGYGLSMSTDALRRWHWPMLLSSSVLLTDYTEFACFKLSAWAGHIYLPKAKKGMFAYLHFF